MIKGLNINSPELSGGILKKINTLRHNKMFYDVILEIDKLVVYSHKAILAASSQYFLSLFQREESQNYDGQISHYLIDFIPKKDFCLLENLINFIYTSSIQVVPPDVPAMYALTSKLKVSDISVKCAQYLAENMAVSTCIGNRKLAALHNDTELLHSLDRFIGENFLEVVNQPEYSALPRINVYVSFGDVPCSAAGGDPKNFESTMSDERTRLKIKILDYVVKSNQKFNLDYATLLPSAQPENLVEGLGLCLKIDWQNRKKGIYLHLDRQTGKLSPCPHISDGPAKPVRLEPSSRHKPHPGRTNPKPSNASTNGCNGSSPHHPGSIYDNSNPETEGCQAADEVPWSLVAFLESKSKGGRNDVITALVALQNQHLVSIRIKFLVSQSQEPLPPPNHDVPPIQRGTIDANAKPSTSPGKTLLNGTDKSYAISYDVKSEVCHCHTFAQDSRSPNGYYHADDVFSDQTDGNTVTNGAFLGVDYGQMSQYGRHKGSYPDEQYVPKLTLYGSLPPASPHARPPAPGSESADRSPARGRSGFMAPMKSPRCGMGAVELAGKMLVCGGYDRGECLDSSEIYDPVTNTWSPFPNMLGPRGRMDMAVLDGKVYVMGGSNGSTELNSAECFDLSTQRWITLSAPMPQHCSNAGLAVLNKKIYCVGGQCGRTILKDVFGFDIETKAWSPVRPLNTARYQACVTSLNDRLYVVGGSNDWNCLSSVEVYDAHTDKWVYGPPIQKPRRGAGIATYRGKIYVIGGSDGTKVLPSVEIYDPASVDWTFGPKLNVPRVNVKLVVVGDVLYAVGGFSGKSFLNSIEYLNNDLNEWTMMIRPPTCGGQDDNLYNDGSPLPNNFSPKRRDLPNGTCLSDPPLPNGSDSGRGYHLHDIPGESIYLMAHHTSHYNSPPSTKPSSKTVPNNVVPFAFPSHQ